MELSCIDTGEGPTVVLVHGTPSSSFEYRHVIEDLAGDHRCLAPDHLGFGGSPKPVDGDFSLAAHQARFEAFLEAHDVHDAVFVLHDFGAAIALPALWARPERARGVVLANTFLWPATGLMAWVMAFYGTAIGKWMYRVFNLSVGMLLPYAWGRRKPLTAELKAQYQAPLSTADDRRSTAALPGELVGPTLTALEAQASDVGRFPVRAVWGMADAVVGEAELARWEALLPGLEVDRLDDVGHFVAEEAPDAIAAAVRALAGRAGSGADSEVREAG